MTYCMTFIQSFETYILTLKCHPMSKVMKKLNNYYDLMYMFDINFCHNMHNSGVIFKLDVGLH